MTSEGGQSAAASLQSSRFRSSASASGHTSAAHHAKASSAVHAAAGGIKGKGAIRRAAEKGRHSLSLFCLFVQFNHRRSTHPPAPSRSFRLTPLPCAPSLCRRGDSARAMNRRLALEAGLGEDADAFEMLEKIGEGTYGVVYKAERKADGGRRQRRGGGGRGDGMMRRGRERERERERDREASDHPLPVASCLRDAAAGARASAA